MPWHFWAAESAGMLAAITVMASGLVLGTPLGPMVARWAFRGRQ